MVVGVLQLTLFLPENHSLKGKRQVLRAIKDRVRSKFNVSIAESDGHDLWQRAELGICQVGSDRAFVDSALREVVNFIDSLGLDNVSDDSVQVRACGLGCVGDTVSLEDLVVRDPHPATGSSGRAAEVRGLFDHDRR